MNKKILGKDLEVSAIGLGCMGMSHAYGTVSTKQEAEKLIEKAIILCWRPNVGYALMRQPQR